MLALDDPGADGVGVDGSRLFDIGARPNLLEPKRCMRLGGWKRRHVCRR